MKSDFHLTKRSKAILSVIISLVFAIGIPFCINQDPKPEVATSFTHVRTRLNSKIVVLISSGHGGVKDNVYQTAGKQSPEWPDGLKIYEGESCQILAAELYTSLLNNDIEAQLLKPNVYDYTNYKRAEKVNYWFNIEPRIIFISLHHNAQPTQNADYTDFEGYKGFLHTPGATGTEIYTTPGETKSDFIATYIYNELDCEFPDIVFRSDFRDGDPDKEAYFTVLTATNSPAVLIEWMFMTTYSDCQIIADYEYRDRYVQAITRAIIKYNNHLISQ